MAVLSILPKQAVASGSFSRISLNFLRRKSFLSQRNQHSLSSVRPLGSNLSKQVDEPHKVRYTSQTFSNSLGGIEKCRGGDEEVYVGRDEEKIEKISEDYKRVYVAVGANMGDRFGNLMAAIMMLEQTSITNIADGIGDRDESKNSEQLIRLVRTSFFRETAPMYVTDQDKFLNGAIEIETRLSPHALLHRLKEVEGQIGRDLKNGVRWGPRPIDLDIIYYGVRSSDEDEIKLAQKCGGDIVDSERLTVPHPRIQERDFVLSPLCDLDEEVIHPSIKLSSKEMLSNLSRKGDNDTVENTGEIADEAVRILPLPRGRILAFNETLVMGILNVTPDSFSDGGNYEGSVEIAVKQALQLVEDGASIIDIGGESTRPGAKEIEIDIELKRTVPVISKLREGESLYRTFRLKNTAFEDSNSYIVIYFCDFFKFRMLLFQLIPDMRPLQKLLLKLVPILLMTFQGGRMILVCLVLLVS